MDSMHCESMKRLRRCEAEKLKQENTYLRDQNTKLTEELEGVKSRAKAVLKAHQGIADRYIRLDVRTFVGLLEKERDAARAEAKRLRLALEEIEQEDWKPKGDDLVQGMFGEIAGTALRGPKN